MSIYILALNYQNEIFKVYSLINFFFLLLPRNDEPYESRPDLYYLEDNSEYEGSEDDEDPANSYSEPDDTVRFADLQTVDDASSDVTYEQLVDLEEEEEEEEEASEAGTSQSENEEAEAGEEGDSKDEQPQNEPELVEDSSSDS